MTFRHRPPAPQIARQILPQISRQIAPGISRRHLLNGAAALSVSAAAPAIAETSAPVGAQNAGWFRFGLGAFEITVLSDGALTIPAAGLGANQDAKTVADFLAARFLDPLQNYAHTNHILIDTGAAKVLVDVGSGERFQSSAGRLSANLEAAGVDLSEITHVLLTHAHPDHVWGMIDDFDEVRLPDAAYVIGAAEFDWWMAEDRVNQVAEAMQAMVVGAQTSLAPVAAQTTMAADGQEALPGIRMIATHGHTPGHMSVLVESEGEGLLVLGDAISHAYISFEHPDWHGGFDVDRDAAVATRKRLLDMAAAERITIAGYHLPFPGIGHVERVGGAYRFLPDLWRWGG
jgi:glyoxylase-like metal-dependent hydrolase (beta-lactamase superfamily II)